MTRKNNRSFCGKKRKNSEISQNSKSWTESRHVKGFNFYVKKIIDYKTLHRLHSFLQGFRQPVGKFGENQNFRVRHGLYAGCVQVATV